MKQIYTLAILFFLSLGASAQLRPVNIATTWYGDWSNPANWSLNRVPRDGDSVVISGGRGILIDKNVNLDNVYIKITGNNSYLHVKAKLKLDINSFVEISAGSRIMAFGANRNRETISIGGVNKFDENANFNVYGFGIASRHTGVSPQGFSSNMSAALPVSFLSFQAKRQNAAVVLNWATAQENDNSHFEIEKSFDGRNWKVAGVVFGNGTTSNVSNYSFTDKENASLVYYRIRQVDLNGKAIYTSVRTIRSAEASQEVSIYASSKNAITIDLNAAVTSTLSVVLVNMNGQLIQQQQFSNAGYKITMGVNVKSGVYVVKVSDGKSFSQTRKIVL